jgi:hypothetical protein
MEMKRKRGKGRESKLTLRKMEGNTEGGNEKKKVKTKEITLKKFWKL